MVCLFLFALKAWGSTEIMQKLQIDEQKIHGFISHKLTI